MPDNSLAPPNMPWLWQPNSPVGQPNGLGPPMLNYAAPPDATAGQGADVLAGKAQQAWQWLQDQRAESVRQGLLDPDTGLPTQKGVVEGARAAAEGVMMGTTAPGDVPPPGIVAYHGSPADFNRFDDRFIGTGEGAQAYGHGLYFAGNEGVARSYRDQLATANTPAETAAWYLHDAGGDRAAAIAQMTDHAVNGGIGATAEQAQNIRDGLQLLKSGADITPKAPGHMYQVNIGADPEHMLQWDQTVGQHPPALRDKLLDMGYGDTDRGADVYSHLARGPQGDVGASERLQAAGIPGIRYADQGSRFHVTEAGDLERKISMRDQLGLSQQDVDAAQARLQELQGKISRNYVVFDANTLSILKKYGIAGLGIGLGGAAAAGAGQQQSPPSQ